ANVEQFHHLCRCPKTRDQLFPNSEYSQDDLERFCESLVEGQISKPPKLLDEYDWYPVPLEIEWGGHWYVGPKPMDEKTHL
ncbi:MAG: hypothetical protein L0Z68_04140, partial [Gammaproteobacteria bacterium]|nr:hypothetical protein [Gammaproteobacteria bacterium]